VSVKLLMSWNIRPGQEQTYFEFAMQTFAPALMKMGWQPTEAWYTLYGEGPQITTAGITDSVSKMREILDSEEWQELKAQLLQYVTNFEYKVIPASGRFQI
jgi:negative regulator of replication initiation